MNGICVGGGVCANGTILDPDTGNCVIDPSSCQDGTVLVDNQCVDPGHITADVEEAPEPNGLGLFGEASATGAGAITLKPVGQATVLHGTIAPFQDIVGGIDPTTGNPIADGQQDADIDTFTLDVTAPVMITVSSDGLHGLAAGFISLAVVDQNDPLANWVRFGVNLTGDTSKRSIYIPAPGSYVIAVADTRTLFLTGGAAGAEPDALPFEYYVSISQQTATPEALTVTGTTATSSGDLQPGEVKLFSVAMGEGVNQADLDEIADQSQESLVITNTRGATTLTKSLADGDPGAGNPASAFALGFQTGDQTVIVADHVFNYANQPVHYDLNVKLGTAGALCNAATSTCPADADQPASAADFSTFFYDVGADLEITGMDVAFTDDQDVALPVSGVIVDENFFIFSFFTFDPFFGFAFGDTFQSYTGLLRHPVAGRYFFLVFDPNDGVTTIRAKSTYQAVTPGTITKGTPITAQAPNAFASDPFTYTSDAANEPWQQFTASGANSGNVTLTYFDPNNLNQFTPGFGFGRLDTLASTCVVAGTDFCADVTPLFTSVAPQAGGTSGRIVVADNVPTYLVTANTATAAANTTFSLLFDRRPHVDVGEVAVGTPFAQNDVALDATTTVQRFLMHTTPGNGLTINISPDQATLNTRGQQLNVDESARGALVNNGGLGADDLMQTIQSNEVFTAIAVTAATPIVGGTFDIQVDASAAVTYTATDGTTVFADACAGGTPVVMQDTDEGASVANINTPAGFQLFGFAVPAIKVFANGFVTADTSVVCPSVGGSCFFSNPDMPNAAAPNGVIAPYWDDLVVAAVNGVCQKTAGTQLIVQWTGNRFGVAGDLVKFQMILDGSNNTIEFVYDASQTVNGAAATIGLENQVGSAANKLGFNTAGVITAGASKLFTPN